MSSPRGIDGGTGAHAAGLKPCPKRQRTEGDPGAHASGFIGASIHVETFYSPAVCNARNVG
jgi:hypothetical protein